MHMIFSEEEMNWIDKKRFGWPLKPGCPEDIRRSIMEKKKKIERQNSEKEEDRTANITLHRE